MSESMMPEQQFWAATIIGSVCIVVAIALILGVITIVQARRRG